MKTKFAENTNPWTIKTMSLERVIAEQQAEIDRLREVLDQRLKEAVRRTEQEPVAWTELTQSGQIAYFDGYPVFMPGKLGNASHPDPLYTTPPAAQRKPFDILAITTAYEQGVGKGHQAQGRGIEIDNPYTPGECQQAWSLGYTEGRKQAAPKVAHGIGEKP